MSHSGARAGVRGRQSLPANGGLARHRHNEPYAALVLKGGYVEAGDEGRWRVGPGDVVFHDAFDAHCNRIDRKGAEVVNFRWDATAPLAGARRMHDPDAILRLAERDRRGAARLLVEETVPVAPEIGDWPDMLAFDLRIGAAPRLALWAAAHGLAPETLSRGFQRVYGTTPARYARSAKVRRALKLIRAGETGLAAIAQECGFADQAHMTRSIVEATGRPPRAWKASNSFKTGGS